MLKVNLLQQNHLVANSAAEDAAWPVAVHQQARPDGQS